MKPKFTVSACLVGMLALGGVVGRESSSSTYSLHLSPSQTHCAAVTLLSPPFYKCSGMELRNSSGEHKGRADWGYNNGTLLLTLETDEDVANYSIPATQSLSGGSATYPACSGQWTIQTNSGANPRVIIHLSEYTSGEGRSAQGCRAEWEGGTVTQ
jgi:hypothetical protein